MGKIANQNSTNFLSLNQTKNFLEKIINTNVVPFVQGSPAQGKSDLVRQLAKERDLEVIDLRLSQLDPTDLNITF